MAKYFACDECKVRKREERKGFTYQDSDGNHENNIRGMMAVEARLH